MIDIETRENQGMGYRKAESSKVPYVSENMDYKVRSSTRGKSHFQTIKNLDKGRREHSSKSR